jgi:hypothetical protein
VGEASAGGFDTTSEFRPYAGSQIRHRGPILCPKLPPPLIPAAEKGPSRLHLTSLGCLLALALCATVVIFACNIWIQLHNLSKDSSLLVLEANPNLEVVKSDRGDGIITVRDRKTGAEGTFSLEDIKHGKFTIKDTKGQYTTFDSAGDTNGKVVINGPDGQTVVGSESTPPDWAPTYPGLKSVNGVRTQKDGKSSGSYTGETPDSAAKVQDFYNHVLTQAGFQVESQAAAAGAQNSAILTAVHADRGRKVSVMVSGQSGKTMLVVNYEESKP